MTTRITAFGHVFYTITAMVIISIPAYSQENRITSQSTKDKEERPVIASLPAANLKSDSSNEDGQYRPINTPARTEVEKNKKVEFEFRYWISNSRASVNVRENINGSDARFKAGVGLDDKNSPDARFTWQLTRRNKLRIDYMQMSSRGDTANLAINLPGEGFLSGENIGIDLLKKTELNMKQLRI